MAAAARARVLWETMAGTPVEFAAVVKAATPAESHLNPPGWTGIVVIDGAAIAVAPDPGAAREVQRALDGLPAASLTDAGLLSVRLRISQVLGPASLAYLDPADFCPQDGSDRTEALDPDDPDLEEFLAAEDPAEVDESGMRGISSAAFAVRESRQIVAVAGYSTWPCHTAHLCVLTGASARGRGLARIAASAAAGHALSEGMLPQWRARVEPSKRVARALGFRELGSQLSIYVSAGRAPANQG
jgi:RimJ/RimL family protein N-acetyltransferase